MAEPLLKIALKGRLDEFLKAEAQIIPQALTQTIRKETRRVRDAGRGQIIAAGLGGQLAKTLKDVMPREYTLTPRGTVFSKAIYKRVGGFVDLLAAFEDGARVRAVRGDYLAIPTRSAPMKGNRKARPSDYPKDSLFPKMVGHTLILFIKGGRDDKPIGAWVLVRETTVPRKINLTSLPDRITADMDEEFIRRFDALARTAGRSAAKVR